MPWSITARTRSANASSVSSVSSSALRMRVISSAACLKCSGATGPLPRRNGASGRSAADGSWCTTASTSASIDADKPRLFRAVAQHGRLVLAALVVVDRRVGAQPRRDARSAAPRPNASGERSGARARWTHAPRRRARLGPENAELEQVGPKDGGGRRPHEVPVRPTSARGVSFGCRRPRLRGTESHLKDTEIRTGKAQRRGTA